MKLGDMLGGGIVNKRRRVMSEYGPSTLYICMKFYSIFKVISDTILLMFKKAKKVISVSK